MKQATLPFIKYMKKPSPEPVTMRPVLCNFSDPQENAKRRRVTAARRILNCVLSKLCRPKVDLQHANVGQYLFNHERT